MKIITQHPVAIDSPDHIMPWGTATDNHTCHPLIEAVERHFNGRKIKFMDIRREHLFFSDAQII